MKLAHSLFQKPLILGFAAMAFFAASDHSSAALIAGYTLATGVSNANLSNASAANTAPAQPGVTPSSFNVFGSSSGTPTAISISTGTSTAYIQGSYTPAIVDIYTATKYFSFNVSLASAYNLTSLTFQYGGSNSTAAAVNFTYGAQIQIGAGAFTNLTTSNFAAAIGAGNTTSATYTADLSAYQNITDTVTIRIFAADDVNDNGAVARLNNVQLNALSIPEPATAASLVGALGALALRRRRA